MTIIFLLTVIESQDVPEAHVVPEIKALIFVASSIDTRIIFLLFSPFLVVLNYLWEETTIFGTAG